MKFKEKIKSVLDSLKLGDKTGKLTPKEAALVAAEYKKVYATELADDLAKFNEDESKAIAYDQLATGIANLMGTPDKQPKATEKLPSVNDDAKEIIASVKGIIDENKKLKKENEVMAAQAQGNQPEANVAQSASLGGNTTDKYLYGIQHPSFAMDKRWNKIAAFGRDYAMMSSANTDDEKLFRSEVIATSRTVAERMNDLHKNGLLNIKALTTEGTIDYTQLSNAGLGNQYVVRRTDALIARIIALPNLDAIFPKHSNVQDQDLITNALMGEFSQAYQEGEISKGGITFTPEKAKVNDVMFKFLIKSFKWLETTYLGYLNTAGSDPIKWNMIEWCILQIAVALNNERIRRTIWGYRIDPTAGKVYNYMFAATGLVHRLISYIRNYQVLPFSDTELQSFTSSTIGDVMSAFVEKVSGCVDDVTLYTLYLSASYKPWYSAWYRSKYAKDMDFNGVSYKMHDYDVNIVFVPSMGKTALMFMTEAGNVQQLENVPGEMTSIKFEPHLESVWAFSTWKEGVGATYAGKKFSTLAELTASARKEQAIFINYPETAMAADATTADGSKNFLFKTGVNTAATALTDITSPQNGTVYRIEIGDATHPTSIAKSGKFSELSAAWAPTTVGEYIEVYYDKSTSKFIEVKRG